MTTAKTTLGFNMKHFRKTCAPAALFVSLLAATESGHAQLGSFEASIASLSSLVLPKFDTTSPIFDFSRPARQ